MRLNQPLTTTDEYLKFKSCFVLEYGDVDIIDEWFDNCMKSLFYRPGDKVLILHGEQNMGKTTLIQKLFNIFDSAFIADFTENGYKDAISVVSNDGFRILDSPIRVEKRLMNVLLTTNIGVPERQSFITLHLRSIDQHRVNSIDPQKMWIEIYHNFLQKRNIFNLLDQEDINEYYNEKIPV